MSTAIKTLLSLATSKKGRNVLKTVIIIIISPILLTLLLVISAADGSAKHNQHLIETVFNDLPISASMPNEYREFIENFKYSFNRIDEELDTIASEVNGNIDRDFIKTTIFSLFVDANDNAALLNINYSELMNCYIKTEIFEEEILNEETNELELITIVSKQAITDTSIIYANLSSFFRLDLTDQKIEIIYEIYGQVISGFGNGYDSYSPLMSLLFDALIASGNTTYVGGEFGSPFSDGWKDSVSSEFGNRPPITLDDGTVISSTHTGLDIAKPKGTPILAVNDGTVVLVQNTDVGLGLYLVIDHGGGIFTVYGHTSRMLVQVNEYVFKGQTIAEVGSTGYSTGNHLHFEVIENTKRINPRKYLK